ncbi:hypothetical protein BD410DRAFT_793239 [Rickenella mellea]|uniref:Zn(2)-C6 fungal-type domain-containing protein n=1 Tax=Rickenella mellea TaxID=50990 RepID=A0A4Y7PT18_9AGAM|nr:hypothetical protein BD410DRAFT_793239 [Rickenella mellea]
MPYTAKPRNLMPCGGCSSAQVKCDITAPYNSNLCRRCADKGLSQCPPYKPRKTNEQRDESPTGTSPPVFQVMPAVQHASSAPRAVETRGNHYSSFATDPSMAFTDRTSSVKEVETLLAPEPLFTEPCTDLLSTYRRFKVSRWQRVIFALRMLLIYLRWSRSLRRDSLLLAWR